MKYFYTFTVLAFMLACYFIIIALIDLEMSSMYSMLREPLPTPRRVSEY